MHDGINLMDDLSSSTTDVWMGDILMWGQFGLVTTNVLFQKKTYASGHLYTGQAIN